MIAMKHLLFLTLTLVFSVVAQESQLLKDFSAGYNGFTADVYKQLLKSNSGNFIVCPLSADIVLALTNSGAREETAREITTALRLPESQEKVQETFKAIAPKLLSGVNYTLSSANKVYVNLGFKIADQFKKVATDVFDAEIQNVDFSKKQQTADEINRWVEDRTHDKIKNLISPDLLSEDTRTVLVNAIYFHGRWEQAFDASFTIEQPFYINSKKHVRTDMMVLPDFFQYYECTKLNAKFLKLDYEGDDVSMHVVLPNDIEGLAALENKIEDILTPPNYTVEEVSVLLPKFKTETEIKFKPILQAIGIKSAFEDYANFRGVGAQQEDLKISEVIQKAFIEVEEKGTTAAAATAVFEVAVMSAILEVDEPKKFHADHPFLYYLRLNKLGINFFVGRYKSP